MTAGGVAETGDPPVCGVMALAALGLVELDDEFELDAWWLWLWLDDELCELPLMALRIIFNMALVRTSSNFPQKFR